MVCGFSEGKTVFIGLMMTKAYLESKPNDTMTLRVPAAYRKPGRYPTRYRVVHDASTKRTRIEVFVQWYNHVHHDSAIRFVTPDDRHTGREHAILANGQQVYSRAKARQPERWTKQTRNWSPIPALRLNPEQHLRTDA